MTDAEFGALLQGYRIEHGVGFRLADHDPEGAAGHDLDKEDGPKLLALGIERLALRQDLLAAQDRWSVLCVFQAMDAAGKDGAIKHVFTGVNPQGVKVTAFKAPNPTELDHDFLWRHIAHLPARGEIGIHNRSWYEEVLVARVRPDILGRQKLPAPVVGPNIFAERLADIAAFEAYLARQGTVILKFFLNVSKAEQRRRLLARLDDPAKHWKFDAGDVAERGRWDDYMAAYETAIRATAAPHAPWYVVPADRKWYARLIVAAAIVRALERLDLHYPAVDKAQRAALKQARAALDAT